METKLPLNEHSLAYYQRELSYLLERIKDLESTMLQAGTLAGTLNAGLLGVAFSQQSAIFLFGASLVAFGLTALVMRARKLQLVHYYRGLQLEMLLAPDGDTETPLQLHTSALISESYKILKLDDKSERRQALKNSNVTRRGIFFLLPLSGAILELLIGLVTMIFYQWPLI